MKLNVAFLFIILLFNTSISATEMDGKQIITLEGCQDPILPVTTVSFTIMNNVVIEEHRYNNDKSFTFKHNINKTWVEGGIYYLFTGWSDSGSGTKKALTIQYSGKSVQKYSVELIGDNVEDALLMNAKDEYYVCHNKSQR